MSVPVKLPMSFERKTIIDETRILNRNYRGVPGRVAAHLKEGVVVICKDRGILVTKCRQDEKSKVTFKATDVLPATGMDLY